MSYNYNKKAIMDLLENASALGRNCLYEHEVYEILKVLSLETPKYIFIKIGDEVQQDNLHALADKAVLKVVSPDIAHKQKVGGVKVLKNISAKSITFEINEMQKNIESAFKGKKQPAIDGFLLTEFIEFNPSLGNEVLYGFRQDYAFGPVLTLSKGGDDAEFFAKYYDPANLILPPLDYNNALKEISSTLNIRHKYTNPQGKTYLSMLAKVASALSYLAYDFSNVSGKNNNFVITEMDINPFVLSSDGRFVAVDGFAKFSKNKSDKKLLTIRTKNLEKFFEPKAIAVIGVSSNPKKQSLGREIAKLLHNLGRENLYLVNSKGGSIKIGEKEFTLYKDFNDIQQNVDLIVYAAPAKFTLSFIKSLGADSQKAIILISGIPSDMEYSDFKKDMDSTLPDGIRTIGPNCMGVFHAANEHDKGLNTLFIEKRKLEIKSSPKSNTALLTQSGALALTLIDKLNNSRLLKSIVSFGNKYDVLITDLVEYFSRDENTDVIALYVEGFDRAEGRVFFEQSCKIQKPIIVYKSGKTEAGARAAASHTASMSGSYEVFKAACKQTGIILAEEIDDYENYIRAFSLLSKKIPRGENVSGVINAGFESTIGADELDFLKQAKLKETTVEKLKSIDNTGLVDLSSSFLDITPMANDKMYADFVETVIQDDNVDCVFVAIVPHTSALNTLPENCEKEGSLAPRLVEMFKKYDKPIIVSVNAGPLYEPFIHHMESGGIPVYRDVKAAVKSLDRFVQYYTENTAD